MKLEFLSKAKENVKAAQILFDHQLFNASVNRAYYAAFHMAISALAHFGITSEKNEHKWVQSAFNLELIKKRKIYPGSIKSYLLELLRIRNKADYKSENISKKRSFQHLNKAKQFIEIIGKEINS